jgi:hypothetical protein
MAGLDPAIHVFLVERKTWMPAPVSAKAPPGREFTRPA